MKKKKKEHQDTFSNFDYW